MGEYMPGVAPQRRQGIEVPGRGYDLVAQGLEQVVDQTWRRLIVMDGAVGVLEVEADPDAPCLVVRLPLGLVRHVRTITRKLRALFDLDAQLVRPVS